VKLREYWLSSDNKRFCHFKGGGLRVLGFAQEGRAHLLTKALDLPSAQLVSKPFRCVKAFNYVCASSPTLSSSDLTNLPPSHCFSYEGTFTRINYPLSSSQPNMTVSYAPDPQPSIRSPHQRRSPPLSTNSPTPRARPQNWLLHPHLTGWPRHHPP
jgi:hypothetical protein